jgi:hypothetical protein
MIKCNCVDAPPKKNGAADLLNCAVGLLVLTVMRDRTIDVDQILLRKNPTFFAAKY